MAPLVALGYAFAFAAAAFLPTVTSVSPLIDNNVPRLPENGKCPDGYQFQIQPPNLAICVFKVNAKCSNPAIAARCTAKNAVCRNTDSGTGYKCVCLAGFRNIRSRCLPLRPAYGSCKLSNGATVASGTGGHPAGDGCNTCTCNNGALACTKTLCIAIEPPRLCKLANGTLVPSGDTLYPKADGCNSCSCKNGALECVTKMYCGGVGPTPIIEPPLPCKLSSGATVASGTGGHPAGDGCNTCTCTSGALACTKTACIAIEPPRPCKLSNGTMIPSGTGGKDDCNFCSCINGDLVCTMMACPPASCKLSSGATVASGTGGHPAGDGCNTCTCTNGALACTKTACLPLPCELANGTLVPSGDTLYPKADGCNSCSCKNGALECVTKMYCGGVGPTPIIEPPLPCKLSSGATVASGTGGHPAGDGCNTCTCTNGALACTKTACLPLPCSNPPCIAIEPPRPCKLANGTLVPSGDTLYPKADGCNSCSCKNGALECITKIYCGGVGPTPIIEPPLPCKLSNGATVASGTGGHPAADGCNTCMCTNGALACTKTLCLPLTCKLANGAIVESGTGGHAAGDGCNTCTCNNGALACTKTACIAMEPPRPCKLSNGTMIPSGTGGKDDCNFCSCINGDLVCTAMACPPASCKLSSGATVASGTGGHPAGDGCNTCTCTNGALACTKTACLALPCSNPPCIAIKPPLPCRLANGTEVPSGTGGHRTGDRCNTCMCDNGVLVCTKTPCIAIEPPLPCRLANGAEVSSGTGGHAAGDGCNTCTCNNGALTCTKTACNVLPPGPVYPEGQSCRLFNGNVVPAGTGNHPAGDGCNTCQCTDTGVLACTKLSCGNQGYAEPDY